MIAFISDLACRQLHQKDNRDKISLAMYAHREELLWNNLSKS